MQRKIDKRLLLIMPPQPHLMAGFTTGLISIKEYLLNNNCNVDIVVKDFSSDTHKDVKQWLLTTVEKNTDTQTYLGITCTTATYQSALLVSKNAKKINEHIITILGGPHPSADYKTIVKFQSKLIDIVVTGEGERTMLQLLKQHSDLETVEGIAYKDANKKTVINRRPTPLTQAELDQIPAVIPRLSSKSVMGKFDHITYVSARGCPLKCSFCAVANQAIRAKSIPKLKEDIKSILEEGYRTIAIEDNFFAHSLSRTRNICKALYDLKWETQIDFKWDCQTRVESLVRSQVVDEMDRAGCHAVYIGVESLVPHRLIKLNKSKNPYQYLKKLKDIVVPALIKTGIDCYINIQVGFPDETEEDLYQTLDELKVIGCIAKKANKKIVVFPQLHVIYPGTGDFSEGLENGTFVENQFETFTRWEEKQEPILKWLGEHFAHGTGGLPVGILNLERLKATEYEIESNSVMRISNTLRALEEIDGIEVFRYGKHLTSNTYPE